MCVNIRHTWVLTGDIARLCYWLFEQWVVEESHGFVHEDKSGEAVWQGLWQTYLCMRERICGNLAERDRMIAAMAHDLRTPLTRLQLRLDRVEPESLRAKLQETASSMRAIII